MPKKSSKLIQQVDSHVVDVRFDDPHLYVVFVFGEEDLPINMLRALAYWKRIAGQVWPVVVVSNIRGRLSIGLGDLTEARNSDSVMLDAVHFALYEALDDPHEGLRTPVVMPFTERRPVSYVMRMRGDVT